MLTTPLKTRPLAQPFNEPVGYERTTQAMGLDRAKLTFDYVDQNNMVICGDPDTCIKKIRR